jgi:Flp pilus assembly protein TadB
MTAIVALAGVGVGFGVLLVVRGWIDPAPPSTGGRKVDRRRLAARAVAAVSAGAVGLAVTGWPVVAIAAATGAACLVARPRRAQHDRERIEALAAWCEQLRDTLSAGHGISETIAATAPIAPEAIRPEVVQLAVRLRREAPRAALADFAAALGDPTGDLIVTILTMTLERSGRAAGELLGELARTARERAEMRLRVDAERASTRAEAQWVAGSSGALMLAVAVFGHHWLTPYSSASGQVALAVVAGLFAGGVIGLSRLARYRADPRFLHAAAS